MNFIKIFKIKELNLQFPHGTQGKPNWNHYFREIKLTVVQIFRINKKHTN